MNKKNVLRVSDVTMQFGGVVAVNNLNLEVRKGENKVTKVLRRKGL